MLQGPLVPAKLDGARLMQPSTMHRWFKLCLRQAGIADFPMHELRHTAGNDFWRVRGASS
jgi:integrase